MSSRTGSILVIQYNWEENIRKNESVWVYYKQLQEKSHHGNTGDATFNVVSQKVRSILIHYIPKNLQTLFVCPARIFSGIHSKSIASLDVADGGLGVSASTDNKLHVWDTQDGTVRRQLEGHLFDVYSCRLFPSGVVVLSGGADMQMKVWDAATGLCPVTLQGHTGSITGTAIIEKGRNVVSVSKDGTARLWNCAQANNLATLLKVETEMNCCDVVDVQGRIHLNTSEEMADELEVGTEGKVLAVGCQDAKVYVVNVREREVMATHFMPSPVLSLCWVRNLVLVIGLEDGSVWTLDATNVKEIPQKLCHDSASAVLCVKPLLSAFILGRKDGVCQIYNLNGRSSVQLTGPDCDPVYDIATDSEFVYTACRDACVRKYRIQDLRFPDEVEL